MTGTASSRGPDELDAADADGLSRLERYQARAAAWGLPFVDLLAAPPDRRLLRTVDPEVMLRGQWVPHELVELDAAGSCLVVAVARRPDTTLTAEVQVFFGVDQVRYALTTDWDIEQAVLAGCDEALVERASQRLATEAPELSAATGWWPWQRWAALLLVAAVVASVVVDRRGATISALVACNVLFLVGVVFKLVVGAAGIRRVRADRRRDALHAPVRVPDDKLPGYTILVPAFREANVVDKVIEHLTALDYPADKLQILLLLEADDADTIAAARAARPPQCVRFVVVPPGGPRTKPKACNIGLALATGEYLVVYDAEDRPERDQLRSVHRQFSESGDDVICLQSRLNYFNTEEDILTRLFTLEYSYWFDYMLPGLVSCRLPIPLGGTSNHFRVARLRQIGGWDPHNVTEDADLGIRAAAQRFTVGINESTTWEEACSQWRPWVKQRTRWIKGYMVTALVHSRRPVELTRAVGLRGWAGLLGLIAGTPAMFLAAPPLWLFWLYTFLGGSVHGLDVPGWVLRATTFNLAVGNLSMILPTMVAARRRRNTHLMGYALLLPLYWVLHSLAAWRALYHLVAKPDHWEKTPHGLRNGPPERAGSRERSAVTSA